MRNEKGKYTLSYTFFYLDNRKSPSLKSHWLLTRWFVRTQTRVRTGGVNVYNFTIKASRLMMPSWAAALVTLLVVVALTPVLCFAQDVTAAITGKVTDPTGAAVPGAKVTAIDTQRGTTWPTITNGDGVYNLPRIPVGTYNVKVENQGFQTSQQSNVTLQMNQVARMDFNFRSATSPIRSR